MSQKAVSSKKSLKHRLLASMILLALILITLFSACGFLFGQIEMPGSEISDSLNLQMEYFSDNMSSSLKTLSVTCMDLADDVSEIMDEEKIRSEDLSGVSEETGRIEKKMIEIMKRKLQAVDCSGGFILLADEMSMNKESVPGIYILKDYQHISNPEMLLYRGISSVAEEIGIRLHRKWRMEFQTSAFPDLELLATGNDQKVHISKLTTLHGTDENVYLITFPIHGKNGTVYGLCGFEISQRFFRFAYQQPALMDHLICMMSPYETVQVSADQSMICGNNYVTPVGSFSLSSMNHHLTHLAGSTSYVGVQKEIMPSYADQKFILSVMIPMEDYQRAVTRRICQILILLLLITFFAIVFSLYFSRKYLKPVISALKEMKEEQQNPSATNIQELDELSHSLWQRSRKHQEELTNLSEEKEKAEKEVKRLAYDRKSEIDPLIYQNFKEGLRTLTPTEEKIMNLYADGLASREIMKTLNIKENTLRFHNKNIYSKLGVNSKKQAALYANVARRDPSFKKKSQ